ncbi:DUF4325 domain-containing protein [candidate division WWE3 bacterium]|nr:DUF4325 domain-containing protein [candidate division WWE3 bacterium]
MVTIKLRKFGKILNSRPFGAEAALRAKQIIEQKDERDSTILDFKEVEVMSPSFIDEFVKKLKEQYPQMKIDFIGYKDKPVIRDLLEELELI